MKSLSYKTLLAHDARILRSEMLFPHRRLIPCAVLFAMLMSPMWCQAADVVFVRSGGGPSPEQQELEVATHFYGVELKVITASASHNDDFALSSAVERTETLAVVIAANTLSQVNEKVLLRALRRGPGNSVPLLILGLTPETDPTLLKTWSGGVAVGCKRLERPLDLHYAIGHVPGLTGQLTGLEIPFPRKNSFYFARPEHSEGLEIIKVRDDHEAGPVFMEATLTQQRVFLDCTKPPSASNSVSEANGEIVVTAFAEVAPVMLFIKYCAGERGWHALHHYANLTIDDPSLQEPYGLLNYEGLLTEMQKHNFHTTIAFIPWNYDRSESEVVSLFRKHPERFSISIHGDNHDHKEFTDYESKPLDVQVAALRQSLARMDRFQELTGIPYDKVMIFPHSVAPAKTLKALKTYSYLATVNSSNVPMDSVRPPGLLFAMRLVTLTFGGFPSITRYSVARGFPKYVTAADEFLDNPLFFYCHHECFERGMGAFDEVADQVNSLEPDTRWRGLGDIVRHFYLVKLRDDSNYDVLASSGSIALENGTGRQSVFYVKKMEVDHPAVTSVVADGQALPFQLHDGYLDFQLPIAAGQVRGITIQYENHVSLLPVGVEKTSLRVYFLRRASDFRDNILYRSFIGRLLIHAYYNDEQSLLFRLSAAGALILCICVGWRIRVLVRRRHPG